MKKYTPLVGLAALVLLAGAAPPLGSSSLLSIPPGPGADARGFIAMTVVEQDGRPVACFGMTKVPGEKPRYSYLLIFRAAAEKPKRGLATEGKGGGSTAPDDFRLDFSGNLSYGGRKVEVAYNFKYDPKKGESSDALQLGGEKVAADSPRVFLVDLRAEKVTFTPVKAKGVELVPKNLDDGGWEAGAVEAVEQLKMKSADVRKFFE
jgi:hypothetical protein